MLSSGSGVLIVWDLDTKKSILELKKNIKTLTTVKIGRKEYLALGEADKAGINIFDLEEKEIKIYAWRT